VAALRSLAVVGTGLIGASAGLAARAAGVEQVTGWDPDPEVRRIAGARGAVEPAASLEQAVASAELVVVAAPVAVLPETVRAVLTAAAPEAAVTDVGSTKSAVCAAGGADPRFIGGHPICGAETIR